MNTTDFDADTFRESLARRDTIAEMVRCYQEAAAEVTDSVRRLHAALAQLDEKFGGGKFQEFRVTDQGGRVVRLDTEAMLREINRTTWRALSQRLGVRSMMSVKRSQQLEHELNRGHLPPVTEDNIRAFVKGYLDTLPEMLTEAVSEVFDWLRPRSGTRGAKYATNDPVEVGARCIITWAWNSTYGYSTVHLHETTSRHLTALENVITSLDGKGQIVKGARSAIEQALLESRSQEVETTYFRAKFYKNGNMHLEFKRLDLLAKFNALAGGKNLRPRTAA